MYATEDIPAIAVKRMTNAAMMYLPKLAVMVPGKMRCRISPATNELVTGDGGVGEEDGDDAEDAGGLVIPRFEKIGDGELREFAGPRSNEVDEEKSSPAAGGLPKGGKADSIRVLYAGKQRA